MHNVTTAREVVPGERQRAGRGRIYAGVAANLPTLSETGLAVFTVLLLVLAFPDFNLWPLAWLAFVPLFAAITRRPQTKSSFLLGWLAGTFYFYGSCYWLTYSPIRYGGIPAPIAYFLLLPITLIVGLFPALCCAALARMIRRWGESALFAAPFLWTTFEWARLGVTGQLWNAVGYSQAYQPFLIQVARWGGVYAVGFLIVTVNVAIAYTWLRKDVRVSLLVIFSVAFVMILALLPYLWNTSLAPSSDVKRDAVVFAIQPNVPMERIESLIESQRLIERHRSLSESALRWWDDETQDAEKNLRTIESKNPNGRRDEPQGDVVPRKALDIPRVVVWPESPMNFQYTRDTEFREFVADFARRNHASVLFNSLEPAPANGAYNAAVLVNQEGRLIAQYDKIRLLPFGEYVPLPRWLPGVNMIPAMVGDFTPGVEYPLMPLGNDVRSGVFICFESAFPSIARHFALNGADVLINISNDGYLGPTPVIRQHLANAVFRAVENNRPVLRVTNTGTTAYITEHGAVKDATASFQPDARTWAIHRSDGAQTFYTRHGDLFAAACAAISLILWLTAWRRKRIG
ncbi:MAG: apolipoprotein N-acyltransferase [Pyrinomonadaceae bacterium]